MGIKEAYERIKHERDLLHYGCKDNTDVFIARYNLGLAMGIIEQECPEVLEKEDAD